jgi:uncharacterized protein
VAVDVTAALMIDGHALDLERLADICATFGAVELAAFGSAARGEPGLDSDVDLLYTLAPNSRLGFRLDKLEDELAELFGRSVDLVSKKSLHRLLRDDILSEARPLYAA